ncbi:MAG: hypothetical protein VYA34_00575 [Myxococcota bacterium]|nr:hypothetical protein [Myxococcota bacterium]
MTNLGARGKACTWFGFLLGMLVLGYIGVGYLEVDTIALTLVGMITLAFSLGVAEVRKHFEYLEHIDVELHGFTVDGSMAPKVSDLPNGLNEVAKRWVWTQDVCLNLLVMTPYFMGLVVMLGLIGTFLGLTDTLNGTRVALTEMSDLSAVRESLTKPIGGLSRAFGTSVAGVLASAILGALSTMASLTRRSVSKEVNGWLELHFRHEVPAYRQAESLEVVARKLEEFPDFVEGLRPVVNQIVDEIQGRVGGQFEMWLQHRSEVENTQREKWTAALDQINAVQKNSFEGLLKGWLEKDKLLNEHRQANWKEELEVFRAAMCAWSEERQEAETGRAKAFSEVMEKNTQRMMQGLESANTTFLGTVEASRKSLLTTIESSQKALVETENEIRTLVVESKGMIETLAQSCDEMDKRRGEYLGELVQTSETGLERLSEAVGESLAKSSHVYAGELKSLSVNIQEEGNRHIQMVQDATRELNEVSQSFAAFLEEQRKKTDVWHNSCGSVLEGLEGARYDIKVLAESQGETIVSLVEESKRQLNKLTEASEEELHGTRKEMTESASLIATSGIELNALSEMFGGSVEHFRESNAQLLEGISRLEQTLMKVGEQSDEKFSIYVEQAREMLDRSMLSQKEIFEHLRELSPRSSSPVVPS